MASTGRDSRAGNGRPRLRALIIVDGDIVDPSTRMRVIQLVPRLAALGIVARVLTPAQRRGPSGKWAILREARRADVVVFSRVLPPPPLLRGLSQVNRALVFDYDDALYTLPELTGRLRAMLSAAREVVVGSDELARHTRPFARSVNVIPTVVDPSAYAPGRSSDATPAVLGWVGTDGNLPYLELVRPALRELSRRGHSFEVRVISGNGVDWPELPVTNVRWSLDAAGTALRELDVGLAPLPDTPWCRGKCGLKVIEYMASRLPVVASPVGAAADIVVPGETGLHASEVAQWTEHLATLLSSVALRRRMGAAGRERVAARYCLEGAVPALAGVLERAAARAASTTACSSHMPPASK